VERGCVVVDARGARGRGDMGHERGCSRRPVRQLAEPRKRIRRSTALA